MRKDIIRLCGFLSVLLSLGVMIFLSTQQQFVLFQDYFSLLGTGPYGLIFNIALLISGILLVPVLQELLPKKERLLIACVLASIAGIAIVPMGPTIHRIFAAAGTIFFAVVMKRAGTQTTGWFHTATKILGGIVGVSMAGFVLLFVQGMAFPPWAEVVTVTSIVLWIGLASMSIKDK